MADNTKIEIADKKSSESRATSAPAKEASTDRPRRISTEGIFELTPEDDLEVHPAAEIYPILPEQLDAMVQSLRDSGQMDPVTVYEGRIIDGRTRNLARKTLGLPLKCRQVTDLDGLEPLEWVVRRNQAASTARHLSDSQRALIGVELCVQVYQPEAAKRRSQGASITDSEKGLASEKAAKAVNVTTNRLRQALKVHGVNCDSLKGAVWSGTVNISTAARIATLANQKDRKRALAAAEQNDQRALRDLLDTRKTVTDALGKPIDDDVRPIFDAAAAWNTHIAALRRIADWLESSAKTSVARALQEQVTSTAVLNLVDKIVSSRPWCRCPYCEQFPETTCQVCHGSRWLTEEEYHRAMRTAVTLLASSYQQPTSDKK